MFRINSWILQNLSRGSGRRMDGLTAKCRYIANDKHHTGLISRAFEGVGMWGHITLVQTWLRHRENRVYNHILSCPNVQGNYCGRTRSYCLANNSLWLIRPGRLLGMICIRSLWQPVNELLGQWHRPASIPHTHHQHSGLFSYWCSTASNNWRHYRDLIWES